MAWGRPRGAGAGAASDGDALAAKVRAGGADSLFVMRFRKFGADDAVKVAAALADDSRLREFGASGHDIGAKGAAAFGEAMATNTTLRSLSLGHRDMGDEGAAALCSGLRRNTGLSSLDLELKAIGASGARAVAGVIAAHPTLATVTLARNAIGDEGAGALADGVAGIHLGAASEGTAAGDDAAEDDGVPASAVAGGTCALRSVDVSENALTHASTPALARLLNHPRSRVASLTISRNDLRSGAEAAGAGAGDAPAGAEAASAAAAAASGASSGTAAAAPDALVAPTGPHATLGHSVGRSTTLRTLAASECGLSDIFLEALSRGVVEGAEEGDGSSVLSHLLLGDNVGITADGVVHLARALLPEAPDRSHRLSSLSRLVLAGCPIGDAGMEALDTTLSSHHCAHLTDLDVAGCGLGPASAAVIGRAAHVTNVRLFNNAIGDEGVALLLHAWAASEDGDPVAAAASGEEGKDGEAAAVETAGVAESGTSAAAAGSLTGEDAAPSLPEAPNVPVCAVCGATAGEGVSLLRCSRCKAAHYCSREHQKEHWTQGGHRDACGTPAAVPPEAPVPAAPPAPVAGDKASVLAARRRKLRSLDVGVNRISDDGVRALCEGAAAQVLAGAVPLATLELFGNTLDKPEGDPSGGRAAMATLRAIGVDVACNGPPTDGDSPGMAGAAAGAGAGAGGLG